MIACAHRVCVTALDIQVSLCSLTAMLEDIMTSVKTLYCRQSGSRIPELLSIATFMHQMPTEFYFIYTKFHVSLLLVSLYLQYGGDVCRVHSKTRSTVLHVACSRGLREIVRYLLQYCQVNDSGQMIDINAVNKADFTALQLAASKGVYSMVI